MTQAYRQGFCKQAEEMGFNGEALLKVAGIDEVVDSIKHDLYVKAKIKALVGAGLGGVAGYALSDITDKDNKRSETDKILHGLLGATAGGLIGGVGDLQRSADSNEIARRVADLRAQATRAGIQ